MFVLVAFVLEVVGILAITLVDPWIGVGIVVVGMTAGLLALKRRRK